jgi:hypothetical protein
MEQCMDTKDFVQDLIDRAQRTPYHHLQGYMNRWWINPPTKDGRSAARIHEILRSDKDRHLHDHPWDYTSVILRGAYYEERLMPDHSHCVEYFPAGSVIQRSATDAHRLVLPEGPVWTLFIIGEYKQRWGFITDTGKVDWRTYLGEAAAEEYESNNPYNNLGE